MYGMIHKAAREMVVREAGEMRWGAVLEASGVGEGAFISPKVYSDETTFALIGAVSSELGIPLPVLLESFGRFWISYADSSAYGGVMALTGADLLTFLQNLDRMHAEIRVSMRDARMPSFEAHEEGPDSIRLVYRSERAGLEPFVIGLLRGLLSRFAVTGEVAEVERTNDGTVFLITLAD